MAFSIGGFNTRNTSELITPDTRWCMLVQAPSGFGKTTLSAGLDVITKRYMKKPSLIIAVEAGEGGGTMSIQDLGVDFISRPEIKDLSDLKRLIAALGSDTHYGGIILDSSTEYIDKFAKPVALKYPSRENVPSRASGVPERSDYQTMGEIGRQDFNALINLTIHPDLNIRKHLIVTALQKEKTNNKGDVTSIQPDLPGALAGSATAMFQTVMAMKIMPMVEKNAAGQPVRINKRVLITDGDGTLMAKDRTKVFPKECPADLVEMYETLWLPRVNQSPLVAAA